MNMKKYILVIAFLFFSSTASAALIDITGGYGRVQAFDGSLGIQPGFFVDNSFAAPFTQSVSMGGSSSSTTFGIEETELTQTLSWVFEHLQSAVGQSDSAASRSGPDLTFVATDDLDYAFSGSYQLFGAGRLRLMIGFLDVTAGSLDLFKNDQEVPYGTDTMFTVGDPGIILQGSPTGSLTQGNIYALWYKWYTREQQDGSWPVGTIGTPTSALGGFELALTLSDPTPGPGPDPIPEPATMLLLGSGLVGLVGFRRKFKK